MQTCQCMYQIHNSHTHLVNLLYRLHVVFLTCAILKKLINVAQVKSKNEEMPTGNYQTATQTTVINHTQVKAQMGPVHGAEYLYEQHTVTNCSSSDYNTETTTFKQTRHILFVISPHQQLYSMFKQSNGRLFCHRYQ